MRTLWIFAATIFCLQSCQKKSVSSDVKHDVGLYLSDTSPYQWVALDEKELADADIAPELAPSTDPLRQRLQFWVDEIDSVVRRQGGDKMKNVPKPLVEIIEKTDNAYVQAVEVCVDFMVKSETPENGKGFLSNLYFMRSASTFSNQSDCIASALPKNQQAELIKWHLNQLSDCKYEIEGSTVVLENACLDKYFGSKRRSNQWKKFAFSMVLNRVFIGKEYMEDKTEEGIVGVLAHELGHYYRAHDVHTEDGYGTFYKLGRSNKSEKPRFDSEADEIGRKVFTDYDPDFAVTSYFPVKGARFDEIVYSLMTSMIAGLRCSKSKCQTTCDAASKFLYEGDEAAIDVLRGYPRKPLNTDKLSQTYLKLEEHVAACTANLPYSKQNLANLERVMGLNEAGAKALLPVPEVKTALELLDILGKKMADIRTKRTAALKLAVEFGLGQYTKEQEADDLAAEWMSKLGIDPGHFAEIMLIFADAERRKGTGFLTGEACRQYRQNGWKTDNNEDFIVAVADWHKAGHHSGCFRAFNLDREIAAHQMPLGAKRTPPGPSWETLLKAKK